MPIQVGSDTIGGVGSSGSSQETDESCAKSWTGQSRGHAEVGATGMLLASDRSGFCEDWPMGRTILAAMIASTCLVVEPERGADWLIPAAAGGRTTPGAPAADRVGATIRQTAPQPRPSGADPHARASASPPRRRRRAASHHLRARSRRSVSCAPAEPMRRVRPRRVRDSTADTAPATGTSLIRLATSASRTSAPRLDDYMRAATKPGYLRLDLEPDTAQVYVDGLYAGTVGDFRRSAARTRRRTASRRDSEPTGFETVSFDVRIRANDMLIVSAARFIEATTSEPRCAAGRAEDVLRDSALLRRRRANPRAEQLPPGCQLASLRESPAGRSSPRVRRVRSSECVSGSRPVRSATLNRRPSRSRPTNRPTCRCSTRQTASARGVVALEVVRPAIGDRLVSQLHVDGERPARVTRESR